MSEIKHYIFIIGYENNFINSSKKNIWLIQSRFKNILNKIKKGDVLWFVRKKINDDKYIGRIIGVANFVSIPKNKNKYIRTISNKELGIIDKKNKYNVEIHYNNFYNLTKFDLYTKLLLRTNINFYDNILKKKVRNNVIDLYNEYLKICIMIKYKLFNKLNTKLIINYYNKFFKKYLNIIKIYE